MTDEVTKCPRCGGAHDWYGCQYVKAIVVDENNRITRIEFLTPRDFHPNPQAAKVPEAEPGYERINEGWKPPGQ